jgi:hypothetical protein
MISPYRHGKRIQTCEWLLRYEAEFSNGVLGELVRLWLYTLQECNPHH